MAKKLQSFFIYKFDSKRLRNCNYELNLSLEEARKNNEVVRLGDSEELRALRRIKGIEFNQNELNKLLKDRKKIKNKPDSKTNREILEKINDEIDRILFVPELINISFTDVRHYKTIVESGGLTLNGKKYVRLLAGAGMTRRATVQFCSVEYINQLRKFLNNDRDLNYKINPSKFNAYFALAASATIPVSIPSFCVIPDCEITRLVRVDYMTENEEGIDPTVEEREIENKFNLFDGQGLVSPIQSLLWSSEVEIDWLPSAWIIRGAYLKGLLVTYDFHSHARNEGITRIKDIYGQMHNIQDIDCLISESQFKLFGAYKSQQEYINACERNQFGWGISRFSPKKDKTHAFTTYQYLQNLNIDTQDKIESICNDTVNWISGAMGGDWIYSILYLLGDIENTDEIDSNWFDGLTDSVLKSLMIEPRLIDDNYVKQHIAKMINKKIIESYMGALLINANYQFMISDPYAQAQHALGLKVTGLLKENEHYSDYWNKKEVDKVCAVRSPMTWRSEANLLNLQKSKELDYYYQYIYSGIIFNIYGNDFMKMSGADADGDIALTTNQKEFVECSFENYLPPTYDRKIAEKKFIDENELWKYDTKTFKSRIGLVTNLGTNFFALLKSFDEESKEYNAVLNRIKICNCLQSMEIDHAKGIQTMNFPRWWTSWKKITDEMSDKEKKDAEFNNSILCDKRPYFFRYLYKKYDNDYVKHRLKFDNYSAAKFHLHIDDLLKVKDKTEYQEKIANYYHKVNPLLDTNCVLNNVSHYMETKLREIKINRRKKEIIMDNIFDEIVFDQNKLKELKKLYKEYRNHKKSKINVVCDNFDQFISFLHRKAIKISNNSRELALMALSINMRFAFLVFGDEIVETLLNKNNGIVNVPMLDNKGLIEYMGEKYKLIQYNFKEETNSLCQGELC